ncbi:hypothetical protein [Breoghania sp. L-A4]|uniref:hypothetical protein n=1 Tax=Breoghania sp. L-A4 TaxID=2304600 RepID=UPI0013C2B73E|nr:hypothetical protein [Breoghania sp. L-A4]
MNIGGASYLPVYQTTISSAGNTSSPAKIVPASAKEAVDEPQKAQSNDSAPVPPVSDEVKAALLALQEISEGVDSQKSSVNINGLTIVTSGHSIDSREGVSLLRTVSGAGADGAFSGLSTFGTQQEDLENSARSANDDTIALEFTGGMTVLESKALEALPDGASGPYMNIDFFRTAGTWDGGDPIKKSNLEDDVEADQRTRIKSLMNVVDAESQLQAEYGADVKLIYSHVDNGYVMLTPDDANYDNLKSAESSVQSVIDEIGRGYVSKDAVGDVLRQYGYRI